MKHRQMPKRKSSTPAKSLRDIPAVEKVLQALGETGAPRSIVTVVVRRELGVLRKAKEIPDFDGIVAGVRSALDDLRRARIQPVINGTGIIVHTNLGRSPLGPAVMETLQHVAANYNNLEFDLATGERGDRATNLEQSLAVLCGAQAATVTNNCAAALVLILRHFTSGDRKEVILSRGELIQIGGGFRIPEILEAAGAKLREVGTTNKTSPGDYARAVGKQTALILKVHRSNFFMGGFVESPSTEEIASMAKKKGIPFVEDLGSGAVVDTEKLADIGHEPTPAEVLKRGVGLVCFSGDKLLGGPQAGIIAGEARLVAALKKEPFFRALRCDKLILSALETTVDLYLKGEANEAIPALAMLRASKEELHVRAELIKLALEALPMKTVIGEGRSQVGGGTLPQSVVTSVTLEMLPLNIPVMEFANRLRAGSPPVVGCIAGGWFKLDMRTIFPRQDEELFRAIHAAFPA
jgi:L-seryl-tRNA(Ser) seleniumtransferase